MVSYILRKVFPYAFSGIRIFTRQLQMVFIPEIEKVKSMKAKEKMLFS